MNENIELLKKYNLWGSSTFDFGYLRKEYTNKIADAVGNRLIKVLVGQRRSGKSYILRQVAKQLIDNGVRPENTLFINREFTDFDFLKTYKDLDELIKLYKNKLKPKGKVYLFIDEVQLIEGWERVVNSYSQDFSENYELFISGSNSKMLSGELATLLSGRYVCFEIFPFSYTEYLGITGQEMGRKSYMEYMGSGGLPELFMLPTTEFKRNYLSAIKDTVLLRDIIQRHNIRDPKLLEDIFVFLVNNASNLISIANIVNYFQGLKRKTSYDAVSNYILFYVGALRNKEVDFVAKKADRIIYLQSAYQFSDESTVEREYSALEAIGDNFEKLVVSLDETSMAKFCRRNR